MDEELGLHSSRTHSVADALYAVDGERVKLLGWVSTKSIVGGIAFVTIRDGTGYIQSAAKKGVVEESVMKAVRSVNVESAVYVEGTIREDPRAPGGKEIALTNFKVIAPAEKWPITRSAIKSSSFLYDKRHLALRGKRAAAIIRIRAELIYAAFDFFTRRGFMLISSPIIVQSAVEGGATLFPLDYFGRRAYLSQSAQLYEEAAICAFEKVFIFQPAFRAEKSKTPKHLTEFWMIEAEQAFANQEDNMRLQEDLVVAMTDRVTRNRAGDLKLLKRTIQPPDRPFPKITYDEARDMAMKKGIDFAWGEDIPTEAERMLSKSFDTPFFITDYPLSSRSFYHMTKPNDERITLSADLMAPEGYGEIATGGQRIHDRAVLQERVEKQELPPESFEWYLELRRYGLPPHSGFGIGVERTLRWICGLKHIRATSLFPRTITRVSP